MSENRGAYGGRALAVILLLLVAQAALAQREATTRLPSFTVVSVRPIEHFDPYHNSYMALIRPDGLTFDGQTVEYCIERAYGLTAYQITGDPEWVKTERFSIEAKAQSPTTPAELMLMLRQLLQTRFHLRFSQGSRAIPGYSLTIAKSGSHLVHARAQSNEIGASNETVRDWADALGRRLRPPGPVLDRTGIEGKYNFPASVGRGRAYLMLPRGPDGKPSMTLAQLVQKRLGLVLKQGKFPFPYIQIIQIERPTAN